MSQWVHFRTFTLTYIYIHLSSKKYTHSLLQHSIQENTTDVTATITQLTVNNDLLDFQVLPPTARVPRREGPMAAELNHRGNLEYEGSGQENH